MRRYAEVEEFGPAVVSLAGGAASVVNGSVLVTADRGTPIGPSVRHCHTGPGRGTVTAATCAGRTGHEGHDRQGSAVAGVTAWPDDVRLMRWGRPATHSLVAPAVKPLTRKRCENKKTISTGATEMSVASASWGSVITMVATVVGLNCWTFASNSTRPT